jgi:hypothetical protein
LWALCHSKAPQRHISLPLISNNLAIWGTSDMIAKSQVPSMIHENGDLKNFKVCCGNNYVECKVTTWWLCLHFPSCGSMAIGNNSTSVIKAKSGIEIDHTNSCKTCLSYCCTLRIKTIVMVQTSSYSRQIFGTQNGRLNNMLFTK